MTQGLHTVTNRQLPEGGYIVLPKWLSATLILGLTIQFFWLAWYFSKQDSRQEYVEKSVVEIRTQIDQMRSERERILIIEQRMNALTAIIQKIDRQMEQMNEKLDRDIR